MKVGAQRCVIQRVAKSATLVRSRSVGEKMQRVAAEEVAHVVEDHQHDDEAAQLVDDLEPRARGGLRLGEGVGT